jgi:Ca2+-binding RTX toxin-like protein
MMDIGFGSKQVGFEIAELSTALVEFYKRSMDEIQAKAKTGDLTPQQFAAAQSSLYEQCADLSYLFGDKFRDSGNTGWADLCDTWAEGFEQKSLTARSAAEDESLALEYFQNVIGSLAVFSDDEVLSSNIGKGAGGALGKALGVLDKGLTAWDEFEAWAKGDATDMAGIATAALIGDLMTEVAAGIVIGLGGPVAITAVTLAVVGAVILVAGDVIRNGVNDFLEIFGGEDEADAAERIKAVLSYSDSVTLPHVGDKLFFGTTGNDTFVGSSGIANDMVGGLGADIMYGADKNDFLSGGADNDTLHGAAGDDTLRGGDNNDTLDGGAGNDTLEGGQGFDTYKFTTADLTQDVTDDVITDEDGQGEILFDGLSISGTGIGFDTIKHASLGAWETSDGKFRLSWREAEQTLVIVYRENGSRILIQNWNNGDLGITIPGFDETHPNDSAPLTDNDDVFGHDGNNSGDDQLNGLGGNDGISGGTGKDIIDGGLGNDLIFGGSGADELSGGDGNDFLIDGSELVDLEDWSDTVDADGKSQRQRIEEEIASLGAAVVSKGKGWYIRTDGNGFTIVTSHASTYPDPNAFRSGDDYLDGGDGDDYIIAGEGNDTILGGSGNDVIGGGHDDDVINGGDDNDIIFGDLSDSAVPGVTFGALASSQAKKNGNDIIDGGAGDDQIVGGGGNDIIYGGLGDDRIGGRGSLLAGDADDPDRDYIDGGAGNDVISGDDGDDTIFGGDGDDVIRGDNERADTRSGIDIIDGGAGNDTISGDDGDDILRGGDGNDELDGDAFDTDPAKNGRDYLDGGAGNDRLFGGGDDDVLFGDDGDDILLGDADESQLSAEYHGNDYLSGGAGDDELLGGGGHDVLDGGIGSDRLFGGTGDDGLSGGAGNDMLSGEAGNDVLDGGDGDDEVYGGDGDDRLTGGAGIDQMWGGTGKDTLSGGDGDDIFSGEEGDDTLDGGAGNDQIWGGAGNDHLTGGEGDDYLDGDDVLISAELHGDDTIDGGAGNDIIHGLGGDDDIAGGDGDDNLYGDDYEKAFVGNDKMSGGSGNDYLDGGAGDDVLSGDEGDDTLLGGDGDDRLTGGVGDDVLVGGAGNDTFVFERGFGTDRIFAALSDNEGQDVILFGESIASSELTYQLQGDDLIIRNTATGDVLGVRDFFNPASTIDIHFANGGVLTHDQLRQQLEVVVPTAGTPGDDVIQGTDDKDSLYGGGGNDTLYGLGGDDYLNGGDGDDQLYGGAGNNVLEGGAGNDTYTIGISSLDRVVGLADADAGSDTILFAAGLTPAMVTNYQISGSDLMVFFLVNGNIAGAVLEGFLATTNGTHIIEFSDGTRLTADNFLTGDNHWTGTEADDVHVGSEANDTLDGGAGNDTLSGMGGNDTVYGGAGDDTLNGDDGDDVLRGGLGADVANGGMGNDQLYGDGFDTLSGGAGDDRYYIVSNSTSHYYYSGADQVVESAGEGIDTVYVDNYSYTLTDNVENLVAIYDTNEWVFTNPLYPGWFEVIARQFTGNALDNTITIDTASGWQSHSGHHYVLDGGAGADTLIGSEANETYVVDQAGDRIVETSTTSIDTVQASISYSLADNLNLENVTLTGSGDTSAWGNSRNNTLDGAQSSGANTLYGGAGDDRYVVDALDQVIELAGEGSDTVVVGKSAVINADTTFSLDGYTNVENLALGSTLHNSLWGGNLVGNDGDNTLTGNGYINVIHGGGGDDTLRGGEPDVHSLDRAGHDELYGDSGNDSLYASSGGADLYGGLGDDALYGSRGLDNFHYGLGDGTDTVYSPPGSGLDRVVFSADVTTDMVSFSREGSTLIVQVGSDPQDQLRVANYWLDEVGDSLSGAVDQFVFADGTIRKGGLDHLPYTNNPPVALIGNVSLEATGEMPLSFALPEGMFSDAPDDTLLLSLGTGAPAWLSIDPHTGLLTGTPPNGGLEATLEVIATDSWGQTASSTLHLSVTNVIHGGTGDDNLVGTAFRDDIYADAGNDTLAGGGNTDHLYGGAGDDTYLISDSSAEVIEFDGEGTDTVHASVDYMLGANIERLELDADSQAVQGIGNYEDNEIVGNGNDNLLDGGEGADTLTGGLGDDTYVVDDAGDRIVEASGEGTDTVESYINWQLGDDLENLALVGGMDVDGTGNALDNVLVGNDGANHLEGGAGADELYGGLGDDYLVLETSADRAFESEGEGIDTIERRYDTNLVLNENIENLVLGSGVVTGNGNALDNTITGNAGGNKLAGLDGDDALYGLDGDDQMWGGNGDDALYGGVGNDYLDGENGIDRLDGGDGNDVYVVDDSGDIVVEASGGGTDQVQASASYVLSENIENLFLIGAADIDGTGNALANYLAGGDGANVLSGMGGNDTIVGGGGNDHLIGGAGDDSYVWDETSGSDTIDNTDGGFDGLFFNGIARERITFARDGNDLLIFVDAGTAPAVRVTNHFLGGDTAIDFVQPDGGNYLTTAEINQIVAGGSTGGQYDQVIEGTAAGEQLVGSAGKDLIKGLAGDDQLFGLAGDDTLQGGDGDDYLTGGNGSGTGSGADRLEGGAGNDTLSGEDGNDILIGGTGDDSYVYGGGQDTIDNTGGGYDGVFFNDGITASQLGFSRDGDDLVITVDGDASRMVRISDHFLGGDAAIDFVQPASGSMLDTAAINALVGGDSGDPGTPTEPGNDSDYTNTVDGTAAGEQLLGTNGRDLIHGRGGDDTIFGFSGDDKFDGGDGDDYLSGGNGSFSGSGNDILIGGAGSDTLVGEDGDDLLLGGTGDDQYVWQAGSGSDVIDNTGGGTDWLFFNGVDRTRLSFHQSGDDLIILVDGDMTQQVRVQNHFQGGDLSISYIQPSDGYAIPASDFADLLTPLPTGFASSAATMSPMASESIVPMDTLSAQREVGSRAPSLSGLGSDHQRLTGRSAWGFGPHMIDELSDQVSASGERASEQVVGAGREAQQLIEAMSRFHPISSETTALHQDVNWPDAMLVANSIHHFRVPPKAAML